jgi:hypothetical protein
LADEFRPSNTVENRRLSLKVAYFQRFSPYFWRLLTAENFSISCSAYHVHIDFLYIYYAHELIKLTNKFKNSTHVLYISVDVSCGKYRGVPLSKVSVDRVISLVD